MKIVTTMKMSEKFRNFINVKNMTLKLNAKII